MLALQRPMPQQESESSRKRAKKPRNAPARQRRRLEKTTETTKKPSDISGPVLQKKKEDMPAIDCGGRQLGVVRPIFEIDIMVQPPTAAQPGAKLYPPLTARLRVRDPRTLEEIPGRGLLSGIWALASAVDQNGLTSPHVILMRGMQVDSAHPFSDDSIARSATRDSGVPTGCALSSYFTFPDLFFCERGDFKIRIMLMRMESDAMWGGCVMVQHASSRVIHVGDGSQSGEITIEEKDVIQFLEERATLSGT
ncbi:MAG: hypothetical protein M1839_008285 [Geoglossum umbratile]|nr:MAG: hypothetical protein M1839_008285 [Geoglossum umbratile]